MKLPIHPLSQQRLQDLANNLTHATVIYSKHGFGATQAIKELISTREPEQLNRIFNNTFERLQHIEPNDKNTIGIEAIKELEQLVHLAATNDRYVIISQAHTMTKEAQNAFLKTLEEPPQNMYIFLLVENENRLLKTIRSRAQPLQILKPTKQQFTNWLTAEFDLSISAAEKIYYMTEARSELATQLLDDPEFNTTFTQSQQQAKELLSKSAAERLTALASVVKNVEEVSAILNHLQIMLSAALRKAGLNNDPAKAHTWKEKLELVVDLKHALSQNAQPRLIIDKLVLNL